MAEIEITAIPDQFGGTPWTGDRIVFRLLGPVFYSVFDGACQAGSVPRLLLGVWYLCLGDWDRDPEGAIAR